MKILCENSHSKDFKKGKIYEKLKLSQQLHKD